MATAKKAPAKNLFHLWQPLLTGYAKRGRKGDLTEVLGLLRQIDATLQQEVDKRSLVIIEEGSILVRDKEGEKLLGNIASQLRLNGSLLVTIEHPVATIMNTFIKHNIERRICGVVISRDQAERALETRPKEHELPEQPGEYLLREPGKRHLVRFKAMMPILPDEIETIVQHGITTLAEKARLPVSPALARVGVRRKWDVERLAAAAGEDYCLLLAADPGGVGALAAGFAAAFGRPLAVIGGNTDEPEAVRYKRAGREAILHGHGFDHFAADGGS